MLRLGLVGVGRWGRRFADTVARRHASKPDAALTCFARGRGATDVQITGAQQHPWEEIVDRRLCDGLIVATPPDSHVPITARAVAAGIPVLVEKPLALSAAELAPLLAAMDAAPAVPVVVDHVHLWAPAFRQLKRLIADARLPVTAVESVGCGAGPVRDYSSLHDYGPHDLALCFDLLGRDAPYRLNRAHREQTATGEIFHLDLEIAGARVRIQTGNGAAAKQRRLRVDAGERVLVYDDLRPLPDKLTDTGAPVADDPRLPLDVVVDEFVDTVRRAREGAIDRGGCRSDVALSLVIARVLDDVTRRVAIPASSR